MGDFPRNVDARTKPIESYEIAQWHPLPDGKGKPTAVCFILNVKGEPPKAMRMKSRRAVDELIEALILHRDSVFPEPEKKV
jgi:hypothetical protein